MRAAPASEPLPGSLSAKHPCARGSARVRARVSARVRARVSAGGWYGQTDRQTDRQTEGCAENALGCWRMLKHASCWRTRSGLRVREDDALTSLRPLAKSLRNSAFWAAFPNLEMGSLQVSFRVSTFKIDPQDQHSNETENRKYLPIERIIYAHNHTSTGTSA